MRGGGWWVVTPTLDRLAKQGTLELWHGTGPDLQTSLPCGISLWNCAGGIQRLADVPRLVEVDVGFFLGVFFVFFWGGGTSRLSPPSPCRLSPPPLPPPSL